MKQSSLRRKTGLKPKRRKGMSLEEKVKAAEFKMSVPRVCAVCGFASSRATDLHVHHVVYVQHLPAAEKWNPANALPLCPHCHERHHNASSRVPRTALRETNLQFASDVLKGAAGLYLARYYA